jgi:PilZ domain
MGKSNKTRGCGLLTGGGTAWYTRSKRTGACVRMSIEGGEKRGFIRVPFNTNVEVQAGGRTYRSSRSLEGTNLSLSGIRFCTGEAIPDAGSPCLVTIFLGGPGTGPAIRAQGIVQRAEPGSLAVEFRELDADGYGHLKNLILNNADDPERAEEEFRAHWGIRRGLVRGPVR